MRKKSLPTVGCTRRSMLEALGLTAVGALVLSACQTGLSLPTAQSAACGPSMCIDLNDNANIDLAKVGGAMLVDIGSDTVIVARISTTEVIALSAVCTHTGCLVEYNAAANRIDCNCHGSQFSNDGEVLHGPAARPLKQYTATLANNMITVT